MFFLLLYFMYMQGPMQFKGIFSVFNVFPLLRMCVWSDQSVIGRRHRYWLLIGGLYWGIGNYSLGLTGAIQVGADLCILICPVHWCKGNLRLSRLRFFWDQKSMVIETETCRDWTKLVEIKIFLRLSLISQYHLSLSSSYKELLAWKLTAPFYHLIIKFPSLRFINSTGSHIVDTESRGEEIILELNNKLMSPCGQL